MANAKDDAVRNVAMGATGVALAAGGIAAVAMLTSKKGRVSVKKAAGKTLKRFNYVKNAVQNGAERLQAYQHKIELGKGTRKSKTSGKRQTAILHKITGIDKTKKSISGGRKRVRMNKV